jgi:hypothetical protein
MFPVRLVNDRLGHGQAGIRQGQSIYHSQEQQEKKLERLWVRRNRNGLAADLLFQVPARQRMADVFSPGGFC